LSILHDISSYTGATVVTEHLEMKMAKTDPVKVVGKVLEV
jgi:hypothetical protein